MGDINEIERMQGVLRRMRVLLTEVQIERDESDSVRMRCEREIALNLDRLQFAHDTIASIETDFKPNCTGCSRTHAFIRTRHPGLFCPGCGRPDGRGHETLCQHQEIRV